MNAFSAVVVKAAAMGMGPTFILISMGFVVLFIGLVMLGEMRGRKRPPTQPFDTPVLLRTEQEKAAKKARRRRRDG